MIVQSARLGEDMNIDMLKIVQPARKMTRAPRRFGLN